MRRSVVIDAQAHPMHDLLAGFAAVPVALAASNAGSAPVALCGCVPPYPETRAYLAKIPGCSPGRGRPWAAGSGSSSSSERGMSR